jgi:hypothetical protein
MSLTVANVFGAAPVDCLLNFGSQKAKLYLHEKCTSVTYITSNVVCRNLS